jgi:hypothetical protein
VTAAVSPPTTTPVALGFQRAEVVDCPEERCVVARYRIGGKAPRILIPAEIDARAAELRAAHERGEITAEQGAALLKQEFGDTLPEYVRQLVPDAAPLERGEQAVEVRVPYSVLDAVEKKVSGRRMPPGARVQSVQSILGPQLVLSLTPKV